MTATIAIPAEPARLEVGRCVIATLRVLGRRGLTLLMLAAPFVFLPECLAALLPPELATVRLAAGLPGLIFVGGATQIAYADLASERPVVVEDKTAFEALDRSWQLSRGSRWRLAALLGIALGAVVLILLLVFVVAIVLVLLFGEANATRVSDFVVSPLVSVVVLAITTVGSTAAYVGLRFVKEGSAGDVAATFD
jgi:succinate dehydrogenase hydrophobic anchor subunit